MQKNTIQSINPTNKEIFKTHTTIGVEELDVLIRNGHEAYLQWKLCTYEQRGSQLLKLADKLLENKDALAKSIALEIGKPLKEGIAEVEKSALTCRYYAENASRILANENTTFVGGSAKITFEPLGVVLGVMPWNFPVWQVIRFAAPTLMAGNCVAIKHSTNVPDTAIMLEEIFLKAGFEEGIYQNLLIKSDLVEYAINHPKIAAVTLTGSTEAGRAVAAQAGKALKKCVLELGGNDAFIVMNDADIDLAVEGAVQSRLGNAGQSCIAAKRFIVDSTVHDIFVEKLKDAFEQLQVGNPLDLDNQIGPLANENALLKIELQVNQSVKDGAKVVCGGTQLHLGGYFYAPTILTAVTKGMAVYDEETFGPVASIIKFESIEEAISIANESIYGLGASIWGSDLTSINQIANSVEVGVVAINSIVKSSPYYPFGGIKNSGFGKELGSYGIKEFTNIKSIVKG